MGAGELRFLLRLGSEIQISARGFHGRTVRSEEVSRPTKISNKPSSRPNGFILEQSAQGFDWPQAHIWGRLTAIGRDSLDRSRSISAGEISNLLLQHRHMQATADFHSLPPVERDRGRVAGKYMQEGNLSPRHDLTGN